ncbi:MAG: hypothetical protein II200_01090 [Bacteroidaceae bacterium]|nr:hypothetical protein [Bacteroidaceae bacterium]
MIKKLLSTTIACAICMSGWAQTNSNYDLKSNMNLKAKPGNDFYQYAAGGWMEAHPLTSEYSRYSQFEALNEANREKIKSLVLKYANQTNPEGSIEQKIGTLYNLAMDSARLNKEGFEPVRKYYDAIESIDNLPEFIIQLAQLKRMGVPAFMAIYAMADMKNSDTNLLYISQGGMGLSDRDLYLNDDEHSKLTRTEYVKYIYRLFVLAGEKSDVAQRKADAVMSIEKQIAQQAYDATRRRNVQANYHKMTYPQLLADYADIDWSTILLTMGYPAVSEVCVSQPEPIREIGKILRTAPLDHLKAYLEYKLVSDAASYLSDDFANARFDFYGKFLSGQQEQQPRWKQAIGVVENVLGMAVGKLYVETYFPESSKQRMLQMIQNLQIALKERIGQQSWMSEATKQQAYEKLASFRVKVGYPDTWKSYDDLQIDDYVEVVGTLVNYMGNTPEVNAGGTYTVITAGNGETPDTPDTPDNPSTPKYEWVDLGLSVKWATCNVGASSPEEYGNYYAWGETETKDYYSNETMTFRLNISELKSRGYIDSEGNLTSSYDAATANWGKEWRMPTRDEVKELIEKGIWTWQYLNGVKGYKVTGPSGNSIFLPPAGYRGWDWSEDVGSDGGYWSSTASEIKNVYGEISHDGSLLSFGDDYYHISSHFRYYGRSVRPVLK